VTVPTPTSPVAAVPPSTPAGRWRSRRTLLLLVAFSIGWKVLVFTLGAALPRWLVSDGIADLPPSLQPYGDSARATAITLWNGPVERRGLIRMVRVMSVDSALQGDTPSGCDGRSARVRAYTYFAIPYSEVRTFCDTGTVVYRVLRRRPRAGTLSARAGADERNGASR
jgi:hypothetical protein